MKAQYGIYRVASEKATQIGWKGDPYRRAVNGAVTAFESMGDTQRSQIAERLKAFASKVETSFPNAERARNPLEFPTAFLPTGWTMEDLLMLCFLGWLRDITRCDHFLVICGYVVIPDKFGWVGLFYAWIVAFAKHGRNDCFSGLKYVLTGRPSPNRPTLDGQARPLSTLRHEHRWPSR